MEATNFDKRPVYLKGGRVLDADSGELETRDLLVREGRMHFADGAPDDAEVVDLAGKTVLPGLLDIHVHLREPGGEDSETIATGTAAAARGGFSSVVSMANTEPPIDDPQSVRYVMERARTAGKSRVHPIAAVSRGLEGKELTEMFDLAEAGAVAFSDDGHTIMNANLMRRALEYAGMLDKVIVVHAEDCHLKSDGVAHEGYMSTKLGLKPIPRATEEVIVARDIRLAELTGGRVHIAHVSCENTVEQIREAQARGLRVTGEVTPHHLVFTDADLEEYDTNFKMAPPLREDSDRRALIAGVLDGTLQAVATDHAPHNIILKDREFDYAPNGVVGVETAFAALFTALVKTGEVPLHVLVQRMSSGPAAALGIPFKGIGDGAPADLTVVDLDATWTVKVEEFVGLSRNCPWLGQTLTGIPVLTLTDGRVVYRAPGVGTKARELQTS